MQEDAELGAHENAEPKLGLGYRHDQFTDFPNLVCFLARLEYAELEKPEL